MILKNLKDSIEQEILRGEIRDIKFKNIISTYKNHLKCKRKNCRIFSDFKSIIFFFMKYQKEKNSFWTHLIHDIKSPLMSIDYALRHNHDGSIIDDVYYTNLESLNLIENVLALYNSDKELKFSKFDLIEIIDVILRNHKYLLIEKDLNIDFNFREECVEVISCPVCLGRILSNLISNAVKYSPPKKEIKIILNCFKDIVSISVINTVSSENNTFYSSGLGLNIAKLLAKKINGKIARKKTKNKMKFSLDFSPLQEEECSLH